MNRLSAISDWYNGLEQRERVLVSVTAVIAVVTLFYLVLWEPVYDGLDEARQANDNRQSNLAWMQQAAAEASTLRATGASTGVRNRNAPVSLSVEQSIGIAGLKNSLSKLESSGTDSARIVLDGASFNQMVIWLNTLETQYAITASSATIERGDKQGVVNARLTLSRMQ